MTSFKRGDVILIPFPFTDFATFKQRPAVIVSSDSFNNSHEDIIVIAISSQIPQQLPAEDFILSTEEVSKAQLLKASVIRTSKIVLINKVLVRKKLGCLPPETMAKIKTRFLSLF